MEVGYTPGESAATGPVADQPRHRRPQRHHRVAGSETYTSADRAPDDKLPDDLYARWVQLGTFQPIDRLHSNHSDRLPWQYGAAAKASARSS